VAKLYISEFTKVGGDAGSLVPVAMLPSMGNQVVAIGGASAQSAALRADTQYVRVIADVPASVLIGTNPTATVNSPLIGPYAAEYFAVTGGQKIAVIAAG
jgi:hypothetical protein